MSILLKINQLIFEKKIKKIELYTYLGIAKNTLNVYLSGEKSMTIDMLEKIAAFFKVPIGYFFDEKEHAITKIKGNKNQVGNGNIIIENQANEIKHLKNLLSEKERTIQILMKKN